MSRPLVQYGSKGDYVEEMQKLVNKWIKKEDGAFAEFLNPDGDFGSKTRDAVKRFQRSVFLDNDGKVGSMTWSALLGKEMYNCFDLPKYVKAPTGKQCWAGATAMLKGESTANRTEPSGVNFEKIGGVTGGLENSHANMKNYAKAHGIQFFTNSKQLSCLQLINLIDQHGRLMINIRGINSNLQKGTTNDSHLVNLVGARGNGQPGGTTLTMYNPSSQHSRMVLIRTYSGFKAAFPQLTYQVFYMFKHKSKPIYNPSVIP